MLIVDTGPLVAIANGQDPDHQASRTVLEAHPGPLVTTTLVIAETSWLIRRQLGIAAEAVLYTAISDNELIIETLTAPDGHASANSSTGTKTSDSTPQTRQSSPSLKDSTKRPSQPWTNETFGSCVPPTPPHLNSFPHQPERPLVP